MSDSAARLDQDFIASVQAGSLPDLNTQTDLSDAELHSLFQSQVLSRQLDLVARELKRSNQIFYTIGSSGHEGNAAIAEALRPSDMSFLHYRSGAFFIHRLRKFSDACPIETVLLSLMADKRDPIASGRHKVYGSVDLSIPPQTSTIASHLPKAVGTALSITRAKESHLDTPLPDDSIVMASFGDASCHHASAQSAFHCASWIAHQHCALPLLFVCEDNGLGISVPTPAGWIAKSIQALPHLHYIACNGLDFLDVYDKTQQALHLVREQHKPVFLHMKCVRLLGHAGSDIESSYRKEADILADEANDPLRYSAQQILKRNILCADDLIAYYQQVRKDILVKAERLDGPQVLSSREEIVSSLIPKPANKKAPSPKAGTVPEGKRTLAQCINQALKDLFAQYDNLVLFGEDVAVKGGVYHITADLMQQFGPRRVFDTILDETTILGTALGFAHNGFIPIAEIQFIAYLHNAIDQLRGEAATLPFFSNGDYANPMIIRLPSFAYQKGFGGHFHNENSFASLREIPGLIIACPSRGEDAAMMLRECVRLAYEERRVVLFMEPIALYSMKDLHKAGDKQWLCTYPPVEKTIAHGEIAVSGDASPVAIVTYGNGVYLSEKAIQAFGQPVRLIDLRWLSPMPEKALLSALADCRAILIVDECRQTGSLSEALITLFYEHFGSTKQLSRITAADSFITLGPSAAHLLPSQADIVSALTKLFETLAS